MCVPKDAIIQLKKKMQLFRVIWVQERELYNDIIAGRYWYEVDKFT